MILNGAENGKHAGIILIDLQKPFDTSDHKVLLDKMKCICFSDMAINGFTLALQIELFSFHWALSFQKQRP